MTSELVSSCCVVCVPACAIVNPCTVVRALELESVLFPSRRNRYVYVMRSAPYLFMCSEPCIMPGLYIIRCIQLNFWTAKMHAQHPTYTQPWRARADR